jgi:pimeloyl-ACP methyl ester carboxylesterase
MRAVPTLEARGLTFACEEQGDPSHPPVLLVMGLGANLVLWPEELCAALAAQGLRVIRFDNRDVGRSSWLDHLGMPNIPAAALRYALHLPVRSRYSLDDMADDTAAVLDALGIERAHLVGASMGGMIAQNLAARRRERVASLVSIMSSTGRRSLPGPTRAARAALMAPPAPKDDFEGAVRRMMSLLRAIGSRTHAAPEAWLRDLCERHVRRGYHPEGAARQLTAIVAAGDRTPIVRRVRVPTLVLHGDEDPLLRLACGEATAQAIREGGGKVELAVVRGMGHDLPPALIPEIAERVAAHISQS